MPRPVRGLSRRWQQPVRRVSGGPTYLLDYSTATFTRASEAAAVDPRDGWAFYDLVTPWPGVDVPRILSDGAILVEGPRTNYAVESNTLGTAPWTVFFSTTIDVDVASSPDGLVTADRVNHPASSTAQLRQLAPAQPPAGLGTASVYHRAEAGTPDWIYSVTSNAGAATAINVQSAADWTRSAVTRDMGTGSDGPYIRLQNDAGAVADSFLAAQVQLESGPFASSPIRTAGAAVTRAFDSSIIAAADVPAAMRTGRFQIDIWPELSFADTVAGSQSLYRILSYSNTWVLAIRKIGGGAGISVLSSGAWDDLYVDAAAGWDVHEKVSIVVDNVALTGEVFFSDVSTGAAVAFNANADNATDLGVGTRSVTSESSSCFFGAIGRPVAA